MVNKRTKNLQTRRLSPPVRQTLIEENAMLRAALGEAQQTLDALRRGDVDAIVVNAASGKSIFSLQTAERPYRAIVEEMHEGAAMLSVDGTVLYCNRRFAEILDVAVGKIRGQSIHAFVAADDYGLFQALLWQSETESGHAEVAFTTRDGRRVPTYVSASHVNIDNTMAISLIVMDMTEQRRNANALRLLQSMALSIGHATDVDAALRLVLRTVCHATNWTIGEAWLPLIDGSGLKCSPAWYATVDTIGALRHNAETLTCRANIGLIGRVWRTRTAAWARDVTLDPHFRSVPIAKELGLKAGVVIPVLAREEVVAVLAFYMPETQAEDERMVTLISAVAAQLGPIVQRKQTEDANALLAAIVEVADDAIISTTLDGVVTSWNGTARRRYGYDANETRGRSLELLFTPAAYGDIQDALQRVRKGERVNRIEAVVRTKDLTTMPVLVNAIPLIDRSGAVTGVALHIGEYRIAPLLRLQTRRTKSAR